MSNDQDEPAFTPTVEVIGYDDHPINNIEPLEPDRDIRLDAIASTSALYQDAIMYIYKSRSRAVACWQIFFALDFWIAKDKTMTEVATELGVKKQAISKGVRAFCEKWNLEPTSKMKTDKAVQSYKGNNE